MQVNNHAVSASRLLKIVAFVLFLCALAVAEKWLHAGLWTQWIAAGLAVTTLAEVV